MKWSFQLNVAITAAQLSLVTTLATIFTLNFTTNAYHRFEPHTSCPILGLLWLSYIGHTLRVTHVLPSSEGGVSRQWILGATPITGDRSQCLSPSSLRCMVLPELTGFFTSSPGDKASVAWVTLAYVNSTSFPASVCLLYSCPLEPHSQIKCAHIKLCLLLCLQGPQAEIHGV